MVEVLLAVYNGERFLKEQIDSILNQTYLEWNLTIYDDGSFDKTELIVSFYVERYKDKIKYVKGFENSKSAKDVFFKLLSMSTGEYVAFCDHDDVWGKDKLKISVEAIKKIEEVDKNIPILIHTDLFVVDENLKIISESMFKSQNFRLKEKNFSGLLVQNNVTGCTVLANRKLVEFCVKIPKEAVMHDWWVALVAAAFGKICFLKEKTVFYRQHEGNYIGAKEVRSFKYILNRLFSREELKKNKEDSYRQAKAFLEIYRGLLSQEKLKILENYIKTEKYKKFKKVFFLLFGGFLKDGIIRKIGQFFLV